MTTPQTTAPSPPATCTGCRRTTTIPQLLTITPRSYRSKKSAPRLLCPRCIARDNFIIHAWLYGINALVLVLFSLAYLKRHDPVDRQHSQHILLFLLTVAV